MKRNNFIKALIGLPLVLTQLSFKKQEPEKKILKKVKSFNKANITQEIAAEFMAITAWNHLNEKRFAGTFVIKQQYNDIEINNGRRGFQMLRDENDPIIEGRVREEYGVTIFSPTTKQTLRIHDDGDWSVTLDRSLIEGLQYERFSRNKQTGVERIERFTSSGHGLGQVKMIERYIELGFLKYEK